VEKEIENVIATRRRQAQVGGWVLGIVAVAMMYRLFSEAIVDDQLVDGLMITLFLCLSSQCMETARTLKLLSQLASRLKQ
jgi:hypothetical protein